MKHASEKQSLQRSSYSGKRLWFLGIWEELRTSYWFIPALMSVGSVILFGLLLWVDYHLPDADGDLPWWLYTGGPESARGLLSTLASSLITVAGVVFSVTLVALSLASQQYGPRLLYNFMRDRGNQAVLGTFIGTFLYSVLLLRSITESTPEDATIPHLSVSAALLFAMASIGVLIYFIHHVALSIHASHIVDTVSTELEATIRSTLPLADLELDFEEFPEEAKEEFRIEDAALVNARKRGYVLSINYSALIRIAVESDVVIHVLHMAGDYSFHEGEMFCVWPKERSTEELRHRISECCLTDIRRTLTQDVEFPIAQLVEVAVRSVSPSLNDPFTAIMAIDRLADNLVRLKEHRIPSPCRGIDGKLRLIIKSRSPQSLIQTAFEQIRIYSSANPDVLARLLEVIDLLLGKLEDEGYRKELMKQAQMIANNLDKIPEERDRERILACFRSVEKRYQETCMRPMRA